jgi:hypothetical protein
VLVFMVFDGDSFTLQMHEWISGLRHGGNVLERLSLS